MIPIKNTNAFSANSEYSCHSLPILWGATFIDAAMDSNTYSCIWTIHLLGVGHLHSMNESLFVSLILFRSHGTRIIAQLCIMLKWQLCLLHGADLQFANHGCCLHTLIFLRAQFHHDTKYVHCSWSVMTWSGNWQSIWFQTGTDSCGPLGVWILIFWISSSLCVYRQLRLPKFYHLHIIKIISAIFALYPVVHHSVFECTLCVLNLQINRFQQYQHGFPAHSCMAWSAFQPSLSWLC